MQAAYQHQQQIILQLIKDCNNEHNLHKRIEILYSINSILPTEHQLNILLATSECYRNNTYTCLGPFSDFLKSCMMRVYFISLNTSFFFYFSGS
jgi:hypothetical protein